MSELYPTLLQRASAVADAFAATRAHWTPGVGREVMFQPLDDLAERLAREPSCLPYDELRTVVLASREMRKRGGLAGQPRLALHTLLLDLDEMLTMTHPTPEDAAAQLQSLRATLEPFLMVARAIPQNMPDNARIEASIPRRLTPQAMAELTIEGQAPAHPFVHLVLSVDGLDVSHFRALLEAAGAAS